MVKRALLVAVLAACGRFEDPNIAIDLRVLAAVAEPPDQLVTVDLNDPMPAGVLAQLAPVQVCWLVTDPNFDRRLRWAMTVCNVDDNSRCTDPQYPIYPADGSCTQAPCFTDDMDVTMPEPQQCATIPPDANLLNVIVPIVQGDPFHGLGGVNVFVQLEVGGEAADPMLDLYAVKQLVISPHIPAARTANHNPFLQKLTPLVASLDGISLIGLPMGRCVDQNAAGSTQLVVQPGDVVTLQPQEGVGARETYTVPTLDGGTATFTEALTYQWTAGDGSFSSGNTGGPRDEFGNDPPTDTKWTAPSASDLGGARKDVPLWVVQRDERMGEAWYETCIRVQP